MILPGTDGVDHLNIYSKAKTPLGRWLSNFAYSPIGLPEHGQFASIETYWYWLGCENDTLRSLYGWKAKSEGSKRDRTIQHDNFEELIKQALPTARRSHRY